MDGSNIMDTSGFYKLSKNKLLYGPNKIWNKNYTLSKEDHSMTEPIDGWFWYNSFEEACILLQIDPEKHRHILPLDPEVPELPFLPGVLPNEPH